MQLNKLDLFTDRVNKEIRRYNKINVFLIFICVILVIIMLGTIFFYFIDLENLPYDNGKKQIFIDKKYNYNNSFSFIETYSIVVLKETDFTRVYIGDIIYYDFGTYKLGVITDIKAGYGFIVQTPNLNEYIIRFEQIKWSYNSIKKDLGKVIYSLKGLGGTFSRFICLMLIGVNVFIINKSKRTIFELEKEKINN